MITFLGLEFILTVRKPLISKWWCLLERYMDTLLNPMGRKYTCAMPGRETWNWELGTVITLTIALEDKMLPFPLLCLPPPFPPQTGFLCLGMHTAKYETLSLTRALLFSPLTFNRDALKLLRPNFKFLLGEIDEDRLGQVFMPRCL